MSKFPALQFFSFNVQGNFFLSLGEIQMSVAHCSVKYRQVVWKVFLSFLFTLCAHRFQRGQTQFLTYVCLSALQSYLFWVFYPDLVVHIDSDEIIDPRPASITRYTKSQNCQVPKYCEIQAKMFTLLIGLQLECCLTLTTDVLKWSKSSPKLFPIQ